MNCFYYGYETTTFFLDIQRQIQRKVSWANLFNSATVEDGNESDQQKEESIYTSFGSICR